jgi:hypothetical protein
MTNSVVDRVEAFIQRIHDGTYKIDPAANQIITEGTTNLAQSLAMTMHEYDILKSSTLSPNQQVAARCLIWINLAFTSGVVKEGDSLVQRLKDKDDQIKSLKEENLQLKEEAKKCAEELIFIQGKYDECQQLTKNILPKEDIPQ